MKIIGHILKATKKYSILFEIIFLFPLFNLSYLSKKWVKRYKRNIMGEKGINKDKQKISKTTTKNSEKYNYIEAKTIETN